MADLTDSQSAQNTKLIGASSSGVESNFIDSSATGELFGVDALNAGGTQGAITVGTSAVEVKVGASALTNRKLVTLHNNSNATFYWGYTSGVTTSTGTPIFKDQVMFWAAKSSAPIYVITGSAGKNGRVTESP